MTSKIESIQELSKELPTDPIAWLEDFDEYSTI
jgi:hypothetical protein